MDLATRISVAPLGKTHLFFVGQAGFIFKSSKGTTLGVDMYLSSCVERAEGNDGFKRLTPRLLEPDELIFDHVLATHPHYDHFDMDAIPILMNNDHTKLYTSVNCKTEIQRLMMKEDCVTYIVPGDELDADDIHITCTPCDHGTGAPDAVGLVISIDGKNIYIAGDTCLRLDTAKEIKKKFSHIDILIAPINGAFGNLNEHECVDLEKVIDADLVIPCHYGTFATHGGNPGVFRETMIKELPDKKYLLMAQGEELTL